MHPNPIFRSDDHAKSLVFATARGFGALSVNGDNGPLAAHIPFIFNADRSRVAFHMMRSNPVARAAGPALLAVNGPDGYISPDWYGAPELVPTWNYVAVHIRGNLRILESEALEPHLRALSNEFEQRLRPKPVWDLDKVSRDSRKKMMRMLVPAELEITDVDATWKLGQNKPETAITGAVNALKSSAIGAETAALAALMEDFL
ncbi:MAG: FMN-binding negative transcriptional regulator [Rhodobacteraceae bacterium]|nr:FMN-binding negative transcriptional regulator [Paracoccaceae bacterium]